MYQPPNPSASPVIQWYPGHMAKAKRDIAKDLQLVDLVIQVLDARIPFSSRNRDLAEMIQKKTQVFFLNKMDLAETDATRAWLGFFRTEKSFAAAGNSNRKQGIKELLGTLRQAAEPLMRSLEAKGRLRRPIRAMIIGIPNSGKSTLINAIASQAAAKTENRPGVTRGAQWVKTSFGFELLDTPGVLWPKFASEETAFNLAVTGAISDLVFPRDYVASRLAAWLAQEHPHALPERYKLESLPLEPQEIIEAIGQKRGLLASGGLVRRDDAALLLLQEFRNGKLGRFTLDRPPFPAERKSD
ncbi:MAG: ribosome biogenesis GTPase YlqF [Clostridiales bacterium]|nr:ribosome biogenesis GTPase YlqF [Clostridiales bacterium]